MTSHDSASRSPRPRSYLLVALLILGLTAALGTPALAAPRTDDLSTGGASAPAANLKAITAMDSKRSELRQEPSKQAAKGKVSTNVKSLAATGSAGTPTQNMGNPAQKTVFQVDKLSIAKTTDDADGNTSTQQAAALNANMTGVDGSHTTGDVAEPGRAIIDHQYPTSGGRFVNGNAESTLALREGVAGSDAVWSLGTISQTAEQPTMGSPTLSPAVGTTYAIVQGGVAVTNTAATGNSAFGTQVSSTAVGASPGDDQQWAVVDSGAGDGTVLLVSRADGLCLTREGPNDAQVAAVDTCTSDASRHWEFLNDAGDLLILPPNGAVLFSAALGSANGSGQAGPLSPTTDQSWDVRPIEEKGGSVPTWSAPRANGYTTGNLTAPYDLAVGDLDGAIGSDQLYHDEAVVAYTDSDDNWALRVIDYNANASRLLVTAPASSISFGKNGQVVNGKWYPGSLIVQVGDFDGDGTNEILAGFQDGDGDLTLSFWRYVANADGSRSLNLVNTDNCNSCDGQPFKGSGPAQTLVSGYTDTAAGDFDGDGAADLAVAFATSTKSTFDSSVLTPSLGVVTFNPDLSIRSTEVTRTGIAHYLPLALQADPTRTGAGLQLQSGIFDMDPDTGFGYQRRELAMSWVSVTYEGEENCTFTDECDLYGRTPQFQFYAVNDTTCPSGSSYSVCTTTAAMTSKQPGLTSPYPQHTKTYDEVKYGDPQPDVQPMVMTAGAFGGTGADDPPVWGLWFLQWRRNLQTDGATNDYQVATSWVVPWKDAADPSTPVITDSYIDHASSNPMYFAVTAYDRFGDSMILGSPVLLDVDNSDSLDMLAAQPPKFADYLGGKMVNATVSPNYYLSTTSTSGTEWSSSVSNANTWSNGGSTEDSAKATLAAGLGPFDAGASASVTEKFKAAWTGSNTTSTDSSGSKSLSIQSSAIDDDVIQSSVHDYQVYRYPVLGNLAGGTTCGGSACNPYYEVTIPGTTVWKTGTGMTTSGYSASWTNDNALSYPQLNPDGTVPLSDVGPYSYTDGSGTTQTTSTPLYNQANQLGGDSTGATLTLNASTGGGSVTTSGHNWDSDTELNASASVTVGVPKVDGGTFDFSTTNGFQASKTFLKTTTSSNKTTTGTAFQLAAPEFTSDDGYQVGSAVYYSTAGTPKVVHGVNLIQSAYGTFFSGNDYGKYSDVALNLPGRMVIDDDSNDSRQSPYLSTSQARQLVRGFQTVQVDGSNTYLNTAGAPFSGNPTSGTPMKFTVPVQNLSLVAMPSGTTAHFFAVPVNGLNNTVTGDRIEIGSVPVTALGAQGQETVTSPTWTAPSVSDAQQYRIFIVLDEDGTMTEVHPLTLTGATCADETGVLDPDGTATALYDLTSSDATAADPTACGQNNQGYGLVTISPAASAAGAVEHGTPAKPAKVTLDGAGLLDAVPSHEKLGGSDRVPVVPLDANLTGVVYAKADLHSTDHQPVLVYDGEPAKGKLIYDGRMPGVSATSGGAMTFSWTPATPGLHALHTVILGSSSAGQDDEQVFRVWVDSHPRPRPFAVSAAADKTTVQAGSSVTISGTVTPTLPTADDRDIALQVAHGDTWATVGEKNTAADGSYSFTLPQPKSGTYVYRVKKFAAGGRSTAYSAEITITVLNGFVVTAKTGSTDLDPGRTTTIAGTALPAQQARSDRAVQLQIKQGTTWARVADGATTAGGSYTFTVRPPADRTTAYRVVKQATATLKAASSPPVMVTVSKPFAVSVKAKPTRIVKGHSTKITGRVTPAVAMARDRTVQLQRRSGSAWKTVSTTGTTAGGTYGFTVTSTKTGTFGYRVVKTATSGKKAAHSTTVRIKVVKH